MKRLFDRDGSGFITAPELRIAMAKIGDKLTHKEVDEIVREADVDGDGQISYDEFAIMLCNS